MSHFEIPTRSTRIAHNRSYAVAIVLGPETTSGAIEEVTVRETSTRSRHDDFGWTFGAIAFGTWAEWNRTAAAAGRATATA